MARVRSHPRTYRGYWHDADLRKGDVVRKENGTRGFRVHDLQGSYIQLRNTMNERLETWDRWQQIAVLSWNDEDHCVKHAEYESWCDACIEARRNCKVQRDRCATHDLPDCTMSQCVATAVVQTLTPTTNTVNAKDAMFSTQVQKVLGGDAGQVVTTLNGEVTVLWQSDPQVGKKKDADDVTTTSHERAKNLAEEKLAAVLTGLFAG